jgi:hypothetical protein
MSFGTQVRPLTIIETILPSADSNTLGVLLGEPLAGTRLVLRVNSAFSDMQRCRNTSDSLRGSSN